MKNHINLRKIAVFLSLLGANLLVALLAAFLLIKTPTIVGIAGLILLFFSTFYIPRYFYHDKPLVIAGFRAAILALTGYFCILFKNNTANTDGSVLLFFVYLFFALVVGAKTIYDVIVYFSRDSQ